MTMRTRLLIATGNKGKLSELRDMLADLDIELLSLAELPVKTEVAETGSTFAENARLKAIGYARQSGLTSIADDSGLEIGILGGRPGVLSARYGGDAASFAEKMALVLEEIENIDRHSREARFVSAIAVAAPDGTVLYEGEGVCQGKIALEPAGTAGFGYDPIFIPNGFDMTFGQLDAEVKHQISHRARAFSLIIPFLRDFIANRLDLSDIRA